MLLVVLEETLRSKVNLAYRGAIAVGRYEISPHFLIGPAIDEAAGAHELAQGIHMADSGCLWPRRASAKGLATQHTLVKFPVPLKGGDTFDTYTVSPLEQARSNVDADLLARRLIGTFSGLKHGCCSQAPEHNSAYQSVLRTAELALSRRSISELTNPRCLPPIAQTLLSLCHTRSPELARDNPVYQVPPLQRDFDVPQRF